MSKFIEAFYYGNIEPQALSSELSIALNKKLNTLTEKKEELTARLNDINKELFIDYVKTYKSF